VQGSGHHTRAAPDFHDAEFVAVAGREEELHAVDQLFVPLPAQVLDVEVALRIDFDVERIRSQVLGREDAAQPPVLCRGQIVILFSGRASSSTTAGRPRRLTMPDHGPWRPTTFLRFEQPLDTSMGTARIVTDAGPAYIKALGNRQGPHPLACEWVGTNLARWFGLPTFEFALLRIDASVDEIPFLRGGIAASGPAFVTRAASGHTWGGSAEELASLVNPEALAHLVVFDTWTRNCDRYPADLTTRKPNYDNVFLEDEWTPGKVTTF
jgi:hypothetical protein